MNYFPLNLRLLDSIKSVVSNSSLPLIIGLGIAVYRNPENIEGIIIYGVPSIFLCFFVASLFIWKITYLKISSAGFAYPAGWRGRDVNRSWSDHIEVTKSSDKCIIMDVSSNKKIEIPLKILGYSETQMHLKSNIPAGHALLELLT